MGKGEIKYSTYERSTTLIKNRFGKIKLSVTEIASQTDPPTQVQLRTLSAYNVEIKKKRADFEINLHRVLESASDEDIDEDALSRDQDSINELYVEISSIIETLLPQDEPKTPSAESVASSVHMPHPTHVKLPKLELKSFDGSPIQWISFINLFDTTIHRNASVSNVAKMQYLLSALSGEPLNLVKSLDITTANYLIAYNLLRERYHNPRRLTTLHLNQILDLPNISASHIKNLRVFINQFYEHTQALKALDCDVTSDKNPLLSALLLRKMDQDLRKKLESYRSSTSNDEPTQHILPDVKSIISFLNTECVHVEDASLHSLPNSSKSNYSSSTQQMQKQKPSTQHKVQFTNKNVSMVSTSKDSNTPSSVLCFMCKQAGHKIYTCPVFKEKSPSERHNLVKRYQRCFSCLGNHTLKDCKSQSTCLKCQKRHHTLLHLDNQVAVPTTVSGVSNSKTHYTSSQNDAVSLSSQNNVTSNVSEFSTVLLGTTLVKLTAKNGKTHVFRALIDSGSMCDFISEHAAQLLGTQRVKSNLTVVGLSQNTSNTKGLMMLDVETLSSQVIAPRHSFHVLNKISVDLPRSQISPEVKKRVKHYILADPTFDLPGSIDVLLGGALFPKIITNETHSLGENMPYLIGTQFGFVVIGQAPCVPLTCAAPGHTISLLSTNDMDLHASIQHFWQQEEPPSCNKKTAEEQLCDQHFASTHSRDPDGRYVVRLPFKDNHLPLGTSQPIAERRLHTLERRFQTHPQFQELYSNFMNEYLSQGHMTELKKPNLNLPHYFLPHHGVLKTSSSTTKLRTVFDGSSKTSTGVSLNEILLTGRKLQNNICDILLHFRSHNIVFSCDIRQMYRQIKVHPDDQMFQLILWRDNTLKDVSVYKLTTVTYGLNSSPYLAIRTLNQLAKDEGDMYPEAADILKTQTYVDDIISGADTVEEALTLQTQLINLLRRGGFELRKWSSNSKHLLQNLPKEHLESPVFLDTSRQPHFSILGLHWSPDNDTFSYNIDFPHTNATKRNVLSLIAKIYDPCGFLAPCTMFAKCFMQLLWTTGLDWDELLPPELNEKWKRFISDMSQLSAIKIPRAFLLSKSCHLELHGFCDASESGYAAVVYIRCQSPQGFKITLVIAKTRVAPLKRVTLPRLELCGAHLLAQLVSYCYETFNSHLKFAATYLWCDSTVALTWLQTPPYRLKTYVANRVSQAQDLVPSHCWHHILSSQNPADCASRGILASQLQNHSLWWNGPEWLKLPQAEWPLSQFTPVNLENLEEIKQSPLQVLVSTSHEEWTILSRYSSWNKLQRVVAYTLRFVHNCQSSVKFNGPLTLKELKVAQRRIFKIVQQGEFPKDIALLKKQQACSNRLQRLAPFLDNEGLLRVGGRLNRSSIPQAIQHPCILPKHHHVTNLLIDYYHLINLHAGPTLTQAILSQQVWILSARSIIRSRIFKCIKCFRNAPRNKTPLMGDLPPSRIIPARPFLSTGVDYAGPFNVKVVNLRAIRHIKVYLCVFVCMVTKAVHVEVATDLTTEAFIAALTRFVSRRGLPSDIYSDCGTNFKGADSSLRNIVNSCIQSEDAQSKISLFSTQRNISFHFNPPAAPHQGGLWEGAVKSAKHHLRRTMGDTVLTLMEFITLITNIEAMLNSRPLTPLSNDPSDLTALTPGHFLIGAPLLAVPEPTVSEIPNNRLKHWQLVQAFHQRIWRRWQLEYLHTLQQRSKWTTHSPNLQEGVLVLIQTHCPPLSWPLARIIKTHAGSDGIVRVVTLKTVNGTLTRPVTKVFPLPLE